jgi:hypothetical protein
MVKPGDHVVVFGTAHSGTLVVRNLIEGCEATVTNFYKGPQPFFWDRDGAYDGIKREAADIADKAMRGDYGAALELHSVEDVSSVVRATQKAAWVVYATGFEPRRGISFLVEGLAKNGATYDGATGKLTEVPAAWGFGIAYPNRAPDGIHWDVSVAAFLEHMKRALPDLCK